MKFYYVYRHIDLINNIPFYIGMGTDTVQYQYARSKKKTKRSNEWKNYVKSINYNYRIDILFESNCEDIIIQKEKEFISIYGRKDIGTGTLLNKDNGKGKRQLSTKSFDSMISKQRCKKVIVYDFEGNKLKVCNRSIEASEYTGVSYNSVKQCLMKKHKQSKGFRFLYENEEVSKLDKIEYKKFNRNTSVKCTNIKTNESIIFNSLTEASNTLNLPINTIHNNIKGITNLCRKTYKFNYQENI